MDANQPTPQQSFFTVIPATVRQDDQLSTNAKILYGDIVALANASGYCFASNQYFTETLGVTERSVTRLIAKLAERGHIRVRILRDQKSGLVTGRRIYPLFNAHPAEDEEDDAAIHPTKMSGRPDNIVQIHPTKMSGHLNSIINTSMDNISPYDPPEDEKPKKRGRSKDDTAAREVIRKWLEDRQLSDNAVLCERLMDFCDYRRESKKHDPLTEKGAAGLTRKLDALASGSIPAMLEMLDNAMVCGWGTVFPLKPDALRRLGLSTSGETKPVPQPDEEDGGAYLCL